MLEHDEPKPVEFSEACLEQITENLLSNAEKYSPPNTSVVVEVRRLPDEVQVRVLDQGTGFPDGESDRLFDPFYRSASTRMRASGLGIGLTVCKRLITSQGGRIWATNRPQGGAEFGFALPGRETDLEFG
jgi:two-component system sensor histidine kinase KdpD